MIPSAGRVTTCVVRLGVVELPATPEFDSPVPEDSALVSNEGRGMAIGWFRRFIRSRRVLRKSALVSCKNLSNDPSAGRSGSGVVTGGGGASSGSGTRFVLEGPPTDSVVRGSPYSKSVTGTRQGSEDEGEAGATGSCGNRLGGGGVGVDLGGNGGGETAVGVTDVAGDPVFLMFPSESRARARMSSLAMRSLKASIGSSLVQCWETSPRVSLQVS